jgi:hypothetical protein
VRSGFSEIRLTPLEQQLMFLVNNMKFTYMMSLLVSIGAARATVYAHFAMSELIPPGSQPECLLTTQHTRKAK